jgi:ribose/xylose/arabinose/galactoside ABC-type transport system permease subunit
LGFLLALRRGVVDLSVWAVMGAGGLIAAGVMNAFTTATGPAPYGALLMAIAAAVLFGAIVGGCNAVAVHYLPRLGIVVTAVVG